MPALDPIKRICLETNTGKFYSMTLDGTASITIMAGWGTGTASHSGVDYDLTAADQSFRRTLTNPTNVPDGWEALTLTPDDDISAALAKRSPTQSIMLLAPGSYNGQSVRLPVDKSFVIDIGEAQDIHLFK